MIFLVFRSFPLPVRYFLRFSLTSMLSALMQCALKLSLTREYVETALELLQSRYLDYYTHWLSVLI
jgi:hypothetical protein